jgi:hypothetical protein
MAFVDGSGTAAEVLAIHGMGAMLMAGKGTAAETEGTSGSIVKLTLIKKIRAISSTRVRVDFAAPAVVNSGIRDKANYAVRGMNGAVTPEVLSVDVPTGTIVNFVEVVMSEMTNGIGNYLFAINSNTIDLGAELIGDGNCEAVGTAAYTADVGVTLSKQAGSPGGTGAQVLQVSASGNPNFIGCHQNVLVPGIPYRLSGWARSADGFAIPTVYSQAVPVFAGAFFYGNSSTTWQAFTKDILPPAGTNSNQLSFGRDTSSGAVRAAQFDNLSLRAWTGLGGGSVPVSDQNGLPIAADTSFFDGVGVAPIIQLVLAADANTVVVNFDEVVRDAGDLRNVAAYSFDGGLAITRIVSVGATSVTLATSEQTEGQLYHLTFNGVITDVALNQMVVPVVSPMLGFMPRPAAAQLLSLKIYNFLLEGIRQEDQDNGNQLIERYLGGPQLIWAAIVQTVFDVPKLWSAQDIPDELLQFLKWIVGWTKQLDSITDALDFATLRRLIAASVQFWQTRGPEDAIESILRLVTAERCYVLNWFNLRIILDETQMGDEHDDVDPWILDTPGQGDPDAWTYNVRIVDSGLLNHQLVRDLVRLTRPVGERVLISYLGFLDRFETDGDSSQWTLNNPFNDPAVVSGGKFTLTSTGTSVDAFVGTELALDWTSYVVGWRISCNAFGGFNIIRLYFYRSGPQDYYYVTVQGTSLIRLHQVVAGVDTQIAAATRLDQLGNPILFLPNILYMFRVEITPLTPNSLTNNIRVYVDNIFAFEATSSAHANGSIGFGAGTPGAVSLDDVEMFFIPAVTDFIDINS